MRHEAARGKSRGEGRGEPHGRPAPGLAGCRVAVSGLRFRLAPTAGQAVDVAETDSMSDSSRRLMRETCQRCENAAKVAAAHRTLQQTAQPGGQIVQRHTGRRLVSATLGGSPTPPGPISCKESAPNGPSALKSIPATRRSDGVTAAMITAFSQAETDSLSTSRPPPHTAETDSLPGVPTRPGGRDAPDLHSTGPRTLSSDKFVSVLRRPPTDLYPAPPYRRPQARDGAISQEPDSASSPLP